MKNKKVAALYTAFALLAAATGGCAGPAHTAKPTAPASEQHLLVGTVLESMESGGYTYILLGKSDGDVWVAAPIMQVNVGQEVKLLPGAEIPNFNSKTLNRTFDRIVFSGGNAAAAEKAPSEQAAAPADPYTEVPEVIMAGKVVETMRAGAYTYARVVKDDKAAWAAVPRTRLNVGDMIELEPGTPMGEFTSKSLGRTFKSIYFASGLKLTAKSAETEAEEAAAAAAAAERAAAAAKAATEPPAPGEHPKLDGMKAPLPNNHPKLDGSPAEPAKEAAPAPKAPVTGKVVETFKSGGYTYVHLEKDGVKTWVAVPRMKAAVNDELTLAPGSVLNNFYSRTLDRNFDAIIFSSGPLVPEQE